MNRALHSGTLLVTGVKLWSALHSETWRHREAAVTAFLEYLEDPMLEKYIGKTRMLFLAAMDVSKAACLDKLLQIYMIGLDILHKAMNSEICGEDVQPKDVNNSLRPLIPHIIEKICELNYRARDKSLVILIDVFRHPKADVRVLIENIMDITEKGPQPDKAPWNVLMARLEILYRVITEFGIDDKAWNWEAVFTSLVCQSFFNQNHEVREMAVEIAALLYSLKGEEVRNMVNEVENMRPNMLKTVMKRMDGIEEGKLGKFAKGNNLE